MSKSASEANAEFLGRLGRMRGGKSCSLIQQVLASDSLAVCMGGRTSYVTDWSWVLSYTPR